MLHPDRIREMFWLFGYVLPIDGVQNKEAIKAAFGHALEEFLPDLMVLLAQYCQRSPEEFDMYLTFIEQATKYMRYETNKHPDIEIDREQYEKFMQIQLGTYKKFKQIDTHSETFKERNG